jgi:DNA-binding transcriptional MocR family regulator
VAAWIRTTGLNLEPEGLILCNGAQQAIAASMLAASAGRAPVPVFTEEFTFPGALRYAELAGHPVHAVGIDREGCIRPRWTAHCPRTHGLPVAAYCYT